MDWRDDTSSVAAYVGSIENCFIEIRGRGIQWSPADGARAQSWYAAGLPVEAALRVLEARIRAYRFTHGERARLPMNLSWYEPAILQHCRHLRRWGTDRESTVAATPADQPAAPSLVDLLDALPKLLAGDDDPVRQRAYRQAFAVLDKALVPSSDDGASAVPDEATIDAVLDRCRATLLRTLQQGLDDAAAARLDSEITSQLQPFRGQLSKTALAQRRTALVERWLVAHHGVRLPTRLGWVAAE